MTMNRTVSRICRRAPLVAIPVLLAVAIPFALLCFQPALAADPASDAAAKDPGAKAAPEPKAQEGADAQDGHSTSWWSWSNGIFNFSWGGVRWGGGPVVTGSDKLTNDSRPVEGVKSLVLAGPIDVVLRQGPGKRVTVHTDDNIAPLIETVVEDGALQIRTRPGSAGRSRHPIVVTVEVPALSGISIEGSGDVECAAWDGDVMQMTVRGSGDLRVDSLHAQALAVLVRGSGDVRLSGKVARQGFVIEGSGNVHAHELVGEQVAVKISGSGDADLWATGDLTVEINGSGDVHYRGPARLVKQIHGSGDVVRN
jgi:hypothetical protein